MAPLRILLIIVSFFCGALCIANEQAQREHELVMALKSNPGAALPRLEYAALLFERGLWQEALVQARFAEQVNPQSIFARQLQDILLEILSISNTQERQLKAQVLRQKLFGEAVASLRQATEDLKKNLSAIKAARQKEKSP